MLKTLASQIKEFKGAAILTPMFMIGEVIVEMMIPFLMASIIDKGVNAGDMNHIVKIGGLMLLMALLGLWTGIMGGKYGARASAGFARNLREALFDQIQTFSFSNIDKFSTPSLVTRLTTDVTNLQNAFQMILRMFTRAPASLIVAMVMVFTINVKLALVYLVAIIILACILLTIVKHATGYFQQAFPRYDTLNESIQENVTGIRVVKAFVREDYETDKLKKASKGIYDIFLKAEKVITWNMPVMQMTIYSCILLICWLGARMIVVDDMTTGELMSLLAYCLNIMMSLMMLSFVFVMITMSEASARRICEILNEESDLKNPENPVEIVENGSISFEHVNFGYHKSSEEYVLQDINLSIQSGETIGIIGGTGSAKTSLINMISRLYDVNEGSVKVGGRDVREYDMEALRNQVAVVLQKNVLFSGTILDNLRWGDLNASEEECKRACRLACADDFIEAMPDGYNTWIEQGGSNVSGGQRQRLCIARALLKKPKVLILDDSTSAVDTATDARIRKAFLEEIPDTTKLIIAQRISSVKDADRIIVMDDGKVDAFDTHENLLKYNEIYKEVYESQLRGSGDFDKMGGES
ncbi:MAG: ABC transporter ATP-binding protein/permease [Lachnospiraceae bacterium]|nr:ABC transporter ATP-binding protein/permease [Lachnospiraceae bacterium]